MERPYARNPWNNAWLLLGLTNLFWAANIVLGRAVAGHVPPIALAWYRWTGAFFVALPFAWPHLRRDLHVMLRHWRLMLVLAATGIASYNSLAYISLSETSALNVLLLQSAMPLVIVVWAYVLFRETPRLLQIAGVAVSLAGVVTIAAHGSLAVLVHLRLNRGDLWMLLAMAIYGVYCVMVRRRPAVHPLAFLGAAMAIGSVMMLPFMLAERAGGAHVTGGLPSWLAIAYTAVFPSFVGYMFFNRGVELAGSTAAGQSMHLMPLFGSILAVVFLGEQFHVFHALGIGLIATGIVLASWRGAALLRRT